MSPVAMDLNRRHLGRQPETCWLLGNSFAYSELWASVSTFASCLLPIGSGQAGGRVQISVISNPTLRFRVLRLPSLKCQSVCALHILFTERLPETIHQTLSTLGQKAIKTDSEGALNFSPSTLVFCLLPLSLLSLYQLPSHSFVSFSQDDVHSHCRFFRCHRQLRSYGLCCPGPRVQRRCCP